MMSWHIITLELIFGMSFVCSCGEKVDASGNAGTWESARSRILVHAVTCFSFAVWLAVLPLPVQARISYFTIGSHRLVAGSGMDVSKDQCSHGRGSGKALVDVTSIPKAGTLDYFRDLMIWGAMDVAGVRCAASAVRGPQKLWTIAQVSSDFKPKLDLVPVGWLRENFHLVVPSFAHPTVPLTRQISSKS